jgi:hypothetical protein
MESSLRGAEQAPLGDHVWEMMSGRFLDGGSVRMQSGEYMTQNMNPEIVLVAGKALIWFAIPLGLAAWELWRLRDNDR